MWIRKEIKVDKGFVIKLVNIVGLYSLILWEILGDSVK